MHVAFEKSTFDSDRKSSIGKNRYNSVQQTTRKGREVVTTNRAGPASRVGIAWRFRVDKNPTVKWSSYTCRWV
jgi:hypothetical protein